MADSSTFGGRHRCPLLSMCWSWKPAEENSGGSSCQRILQASSVSDPSSSPVTASPMPTLTAVF